MKAAKIFYTIACIASCLVGMGHFFAPYWFQWFSYIPYAPVEIYQSIQYVNFCFSFLLTGISIVLFLTQRHAFTGQKGIPVFYAFFVLVWLSRVIIQIVWPWPSSLQTWLIIGFTVQFIMAFIPMIYFLRMNRD